MSVELNQTLDQKIARLSKLAEDVDDIYNRLNGKTTELLNGGIYEGESANETQEQYDEFKANFEKYYNIVKKISESFEAAKQTHASAENEKKQHAAQINTTTSA